MMAAEPACRHIQQHTSSMVTPGEAGQPERASYDGGLAIAVPVELKGLFLAHQRHGILPWAQLVTPVIPLARRGFPAHPYLASSLASHLTEYAICLCRSEQCRDRVCLLMLVLASACMLAVHAFLPASGLQALPHLGTSCHACKRCCMRLGVSLYLCCE